MLRPLPVDFNFCRTWILAPLQNQLYLLSLRPLSIAGWGRLQFEGVDWAFSVADNWTTTNGRWFWKEWIYHYFLPPPRSNWLNHNFLIIIYIFCADLLPICTTAAATSTTTSPTTCMDGGMERLLQHQRNPERHPLPTWIERHHLKWSSLSNTALLKC